MSSGGSLDTQTANRSLLDNKQVLLDTTHRSLLGANLRLRSVAVDRRWWCLAEHALRAAGRVVEGFEAVGARIVLVTVGVRTSGGEAVSLSRRIRWRRGLGFEEPLDHGEQILVVLHVGRKKPQNWGGKGDFPLKYSLVPGRHTKKNYFELRTASWMLLEWGKGSPRSRSYRSWRKLVTFIWSRGAGHAYLQVRSFVRFHCDTIGRRFVRNKQN